MRVGLCAQLMAPSVGIRSKKVKNSRLREGKGWASWDPGRIGCVTCDIERPPGSKDDSGTGGERWSFAWRIFTHDRFSSQVQHPSVMKLHGSCVVGATSPFIP